MNLNTIAQVEQLYSAHIHAGGWQKMGWLSLDESDDEALSCFDEALPS